MKKDLIGFRRVLPFVLSISPLFLSMNKGQDITQMQRKIEVLEKSKQNCPLYCVSLMSPYNYGLLSACEDICTSRFNGKIKNQKLKINTAKKAS